ncbi:MAG: hypothetical protein KDA42_17385, partial [Planctomycetales bacterium]|nr:hypothetical protein [Planctomycetales bacterium]
ARMIDALAALAALNPEGAGRAAWLHPSLFARIAMLRAAARVPETANAFLRRQRLLRCGVAAAYLLAAVVTIGFELR